MNGNEPHCDHCPALECGWCPVMQEEAKDGKRESRWTSTGYPLC